MKSRAIAISLLIVSIVLGSLAIYLFNYEYKPAVAPVTSEYQSESISKSEKGISLRISAAQKTVEGRAFFVRAEIFNENSTQVTFAGEECNIEVYLIANSERQIHDISQQFQRSKDTFPNMLPARHADYPSPSSSFYADLLPLFADCTPGVVSFQMAFKLKFADGEFAQISSNTISVLVPYRRRQ